MKRYLILIFIIFNSFLYSEYISSANKYDINKDEDKIFIYVQQNDYKGVKKLLDNGIDPNILDSYKISPLMIASFNGFKDIVDLLIKNNADVNIVNNFGYSALMASAAGGHYDIFNILLENGANINQVNNDGNNVLIEACFSKSTDIVKKY